MPKLLPNNPVARRVVMVLTAIAALPVLVLGSCEAMIKTAEYRAQSFCNSIPLGTDIRLAVQRFEATTGKPDVGHYSDTARATHVFLFPFSFNDRAFCQVRLDSPGHVVSKETFTLYD